MVWVDFLTGRGPPARLCQQKHRHWPLWSMDRSPHGPRTLTQTRNPLPKIQDKRNAKGVSISMIEWSFLKFWLLWKFLETNSYHRKEATGESWSSIFVNTPTHPSYEFQTITDFHKIFNVSIYRNLHPAKLWNLNKLISTYFHSLLFLSTEVQFCDLFDSQKQKTKKEKPPKQGSTRLPKFPVVDFSSSRENATKCFPYSEVPKFR